MTCARALWCAPRTTDLVPNEMAEKFAEVMPLSRLEMIPGTGHEVCLERPEQLTDVLLRFIKEAS